MKKIIYTLFAIGVMFWGHAQTTYYSCATPNGTNVSLNVDGSNPCGTAFATWNVAGNTLIVRSGSTYTTPSGSATIDADIIVEAGALLTLDGPNSANTYTFNGNILVQGSLQTTANNNTFIINGAFDIEGSVSQTGGGSLQLTLSPTGTVDLSGSLSSQGTFTVNGTVSGTGTLTGNPIDGSGTINGLLGPWASPVNLSTTLPIWDGTLWAPAAPVAASNYRALFTGSYSEEDDGTLPSGATAFILDFPVAGGSLVITSNRTSVSEITFESATDTVAFKNQAMVSPDIVFNGPGLISLVRTVTGNRWHRMGFPVTAGTWGDVEADFNINLTSPPDNTNNVYFWDADDADWVAAEASTPLAGRAFSVFAFGSGTFIQVVTTPAQFNNSGIAQNLGYNDGQGSGFFPSPAPPVEETENWNLLYNPFVGFLDWDLVEDPLENLSDDPLQANTQVALLNASGNYEYYNNGLGTGRFILPYQAFFVQISDPTSPAAASFTIANSMRTNNPGSNSVNPFKKTTESLSLSVDGRGGKVITHIGLNSDATDLFDGRFDAYYFKGTGAQFHTSDTAGTHYGINVSNNHIDNPIPLSFIIHEQNRKS
jgi:hypothetical protein